MKDSANDQKEIEQAAEKYSHATNQSFADAFEQIKKAVSAFSADVKEALINIGLIKDYAPPDQMTMKKFLEQKKTREPFYKSVSKKKPWE